MSTDAPTTICILGGAGDLAQKKLLPALYELFLKNVLPEKLTIIGFARTYRTQEAYRALVANVLTGYANEDKINSFLALIKYASGGEDSNIHILEEAVTQVEQEIGTPTNRLFYLAIPPSEYETTLTKLHECKLMHHSSTTHFSRILIEKPFGSDFASAQKLDLFMSSLFAEEQIYRIDHYLAKEAVQNIIAFRFANVLFLTPYTNEHIEKVAITLYEKGDVQTRAKFYNTVGALRDVGQNHMLQMLALVAMDEPKSLDAAHIRAERAKVLSHLQLFDEQSKNLTLGQYEGYSHDVEDEQSLTETYFCLTAFINTEQWKGVPFILSSGKAMQEDTVSVKIFFKDVATGPFETSTCKTVGNTLEFSISPKHQTSLTLNMKKPGRKYQVESKTLTYTWEEHEQLFGNAYEKVILDCIEGDLTVFTTKEEVLASWRYITSVQEQMHNVQRIIYKKGSQGPLSI